MNMMKALVKYENVAGASELRDVPVPEINDNQVLLRVAFTGICGSDPHVYHQKQSFAVKTPFISGHEFSGTIVKLGKNVTGYELDERVACETHYDYCGECAMCRTGNYHICRERKGFGFHVNGSFTKYVKAYPKSLHKLPDTISLKAASIIEPFCVAYNAIVERTRQVKPGDTALVIGPGPIGLMAIEVFRLLGCANVIVVGTDRDEMRLGMAREFFGVKALNSMKDDVVGIVQSMNDGYGVDIVLDAAGFAPCMKLSMDVVRPAGQITKIGWEPGPISFSLDPLLSKNISYNFCFSHTWPTWEKVIAIVASGQVDLEKYITDILPLEEWKRGFEMVEQCEGLKICLTAD